MAKILIAEDEPDIQLLVRLTMEHAGHTCRGVEDGQAAFDAAQAEKPDLIILDVNMPRLNGYDACRKMRADEKLANVPIIFLSVRGAPMEIKTGFEVGATEYLVKPFAPEQLLKVVGEILARKDAPAAAAAAGPTPAQPQLPAGPAPEPVQQLAPPPTVLEAPAPPKPAPDPPEAPPPPDSTGDESAQSGS